MAEKYIVVKHHDLEGLTKEVQKLLNQNWKPHGGITTAAQQGAKELYLQPMVLSEREEKDYNYTG